MNPKSMKTKKIQAEATPEQKMAQKMADMDQSEDGEAIIPKKQKHPGKQIMDAVGKSLLKGPKSKAPKLANGPSSQNSKKQNRTDKMEKSKDANKEE